jgi:hypothetical protein
MQRKNLKFMFMREKVETYKVEKRVFLFETIFMFFTTNLRFIINAQIGTCVVNILGTDNYTWSQ